MHTPTGPSGPTSFLAGTWRGTVTIQVNPGDPNPPPPMSGDMTWTFEVVPQTNMQSLRATIRSTHPWLTMETTGSTALSPGNSPPTQISTHGEHMQTAGAIMRLWTIQTEEAWTRAKRRGVLVGDGQRVSSEWRPAYRWMAGAMQRRLPTAPPSAVVPVWAWLRWSGYSTRPDLRTPGHVPSGTRAVRLAFLTRADDVLCSDVEAWHFALNYWYLPNDPADGRRFEAQLRRRGLDFYRTKPLRDRWAHDAIERSWDRIFTIKRNATSVQACLREVPVSAVTEVTVFTGRSHGAI